MQKSTAILSVIFLILAVVAASFLLGGTLSARLVVNFAGAEEHPEAFRSIRSILASGAAPQPVRTASAPAAAAAAGAANNAELINVLELANRLKDETVAEAKKKAEEILSEADSQARQRLGNLAEERERLQGQVDAMKKTAADYRSRFAELVKAQQEALDKIKEL